MSSGECALPAMALRQRALEHNLAVMRAYAAERGFLLAPHGKTTMAPVLFRRQLAAGAIGITVANVAQAQVAFDAGATFVLIANEVVARPDAATIAALRAPGRTLNCLVDSPAGTARLDAGLAEAGFTGRLGVLVELGANGRRAGARTAEAAVAAADAVNASEHLELVGVEGFEGALASDRSPGSLDAVDAFLDALRSLAVRLAEAGLFAQNGPILVSAGGSKYFDRVADKLGPGADYAGHEVRLVVRSGCYLTHDHGVYATNSPLAGTGGPDELWPALELWAEVLSRPEPDLAIVGLGKRDTSFDLGLPIPLARVAAEGTEREPYSAAHLRALDDQHGYLVLDPGAPPLMVGDRLAFGLSHPCTAFDRWRKVLLVDEDDVVIDEIETFFH
ncbi:MAG: amino acid deaminase [Actinomycetota bacterium]|nr:amino acid deaminase [Actinomycetota bacterium]